MRKNYESMIEFDDPKLAKEIYNELGRIKSMGLIEVDVSKIGRQLYDEPPY